MGLVINPIGYRIGYTKQWVDSWYLHRMNYPVFVHKSFELKLLLDYCLRRKPWRRSFWVYSHINYYFFNDKFYISIYFYDGSPVHNYFYYAKKFKWGLFKKLRFVTKFKKKYLLDKLYLYQRFWLLANIFNFRLENMVYDNVKWRVSKRGLKKIKDLKKRYGKNWVAKEELVLHKFFLLFNFFLKINIIITNVMVY